MKGIIVTLGAIIALLVLLVAQYEDSGPALGGAPSGVPAAVGTTSLHAVSGTVTSLFATSTTCAGRIITTRTSAINIMFSQLNSIQPSATVGHLQSASTTDHYDAALFGCDAWRVFGFGADNINVTETQ